MEWIKYRCQDLLPIEKMSYQKMYMIPAEDPAAVTLFKGRLVEDATLDTAAKLTSRKWLF